MPQVGFEPTITVFERAKTFHSLDSAVTVIGKSKYVSYIKYFYLFIYLFIYFI
jgi:hypothetical protein